jgi:hypothetical protein
MSQCFGGASGSGLGTVYMRPSHPVVHAAAGGCHRWAPDVSLLHVLLVLLVLLLCLSGVAAKLGMVRVGLCRALWNQGLPGRNLGGGMWLIAKKRHRASNETRPMSVWQ